MASGSLEIQDVLAEYWPSVRKRLNTKWKGKPGIFPSSLAMPCDLYCYFEGSGQEACEESQDPKGLILMDIGSYIHDQVQEAFKNYYTSIGWIYEEEVRVQISKLARGRADAMTVSPDGSVCRLEEYKSIGGKGFDSLSSAKSDHIEQLNLYMYSLGITDGIIVYFKRDSPYELKSYDVSIDENKAEKQIKRIEEIEKAIEQENPPEPTPHWRFTSKCVVNCKYRHVCPAAEAGHSFGANRRLGG